MSERQFPKPEIMSPAGYWSQLNAAIEAGADAVYFGLQHFTARAKVGFTLTELPKVMRTLHQRGVKGYVTFNTLVFDHELTEATKSLVAIAQAGADAIIVQDVGITKLARAVVPSLELHGSTQMSITSAEGIALAQELGVTRVVLARELSLDDIRVIRQETDCELEMFAHGALCVSYSGQCFSSEAWGGRSANRGQCAQACRLPYEMIVDDVLRPLNDARYLLSPGDLYTLKQVPEMVEIGISALKIEGRYKDENYVALTTAAYRRAVDEAWANLPQSVTPEDELQLEQVYSRGLGPYFVQGVNHQSVVDGRAPRHRGVLIGKVSHLSGKQLLMQPEKAHEINPLKAGDGVVFDAADWRSPAETEEGGHVYHVHERRAGQLELEFGNGEIDFSRIRSGDWVWRTFDKELDKAARPFTHASSPVHKQPVTVSVTAYEGERLQLVWQLVAKPEIMVTVLSDEPLQEAQKQAVDDAYLRKQLGRLGNTAYELADVTVDINGRPFAPSSLLNKLRREAVDLLVAAQSEWEVVVAEKPLDLLDTAVTYAQDPLALGNKVEQAQLHLLVRTPEQLKAAILEQPASITLDYLDLYGLRPAVEQVQAAGIEARVASPRILKPHEQRIINFLLRLDCPILVRSAGLLQALQEREHPPLIGDFSLNAANVLSADLFLQMGLQRLTPTHDLNGAQVAELGQGIGAENLEVIAYQHLPVFHMEHCVFCRFLSDGTSIKDCGKPCEKHKVALRDGYGRTHPVMADVGCRNTVFGAEAQEASRHLGEWLDVGIVHVRLEFTHESGEQLQQVVQAFAATLQGQQSTQMLSDNLRQIAPQGITEGSLFVPDDYLVLPVLQ